MVPTTHKEANVVDSIHTFSSGIMHILQSTDDVRPIHQQLNNLWFWPIGDLPDHQGLQESQFFPDH